MRGAGIYVNEEQEIQMGAALAQLVTPVEPMAVDWDGFTQVFNPGRVFEPKHPLVRKYPACFKPVEPLPMDRIEQATNEPGELRNR